MYVVFALLAIVLAGRGYLGPRHPVLLPLVLLMCLAGVLAVERPVLQIAYGIVGVVFLVVWFSGKREPT